MAFLELADVTKNFPDGAAIRGVTLEVQAGEFIVIVGPSGCGKSTVLRMIAGLENISSGSIGIDGEDVTHKPAARRGAAMVFQSYALYPHMTVRMNLAFGLKNRKYPKAEIASRIASAAATLQLDTLLDRMPHQLSGGQRQRVAIGRSIVSNPKIFLFDEPLSNLDTELRVKMRHELARLHRQLKTTMIYVTHDQIEAMTLADRIVVMNKGRIEQVGSPLDLYNRPANIFTAGFIGSPTINLLPGHLVSAQGGNTVVELGGGDRLVLAPFTRTPAIGAPVTLGIRPERVSLTPSAGAVELDLRLEAAEELGHSTFAYCIDGQGREFRVKLDGHHDLQTRDRLAVYVKREDIKLFDQDGIAVTPAAAA